MIWQTVIRYLELPDFLGIFIGLEILEIQLFDLIIMPNSSQIFNGLIHVSSRQNSKLISEYCLYDSPHPPHLQ